MFRLDSGMESWWILLKILTWDLWPDPQRLQDVGIGESYQIPFWETALAGCFYSSQPQFQGTGFPHSKSGKTSVTDRV